MSTKMPKRRSKLHVNKPYDRPKTFLQKVTSTVSDYLPTWLNPSSWGLAGSQVAPHPYNDYMPDDDDDAIETEEEFDVAGPSGVMNSEREMTAATTLPAFTRRPLPRSSPDPETSILNGDYHSDNSETSASTSGCSSLAPTQERRHSTTVDGNSQLKGLKVSKNHLERIQHQLSTSQLFSLPSKETFNVLSEESNFDSHDVPFNRQKEKPPKKVTLESFQLHEKFEKELESSSTQTTSLWFEEHGKNFQPAKRSRTARPQPVAPNQRPSFSVSAFDSPHQVSDEGQAHLPDDLPVISPFYHGQTTYGGASAYKKTRIGTPYSSGLHAEAIKVRKNRSKEVLSSAAQKVLVVLENMSSPLTDANKIPVEHVTTDFALSFTPSIYARKPLRDNTFSTQLPQGGPPKTSFPIEACGSKQKPSALLDSLFKPASSSSRNPQTTINLAETRKDSSEHRPVSGGPLRTKVVHSMRPSKRQRDLDEARPPEPDLPNVPLLGITCPSFSFSIPTMTSTPIAETHHFAKSTSSTESPPVSKGSAKVNEFNFSIPIENKIVTESTGLSASVAVEEKSNSFQFRSPISQRDTTDQKYQVKVSGTSQPSKSPTINFNSSSAVNRSNHSSLLKKRVTDSCSENTQSTSVLKPAPELILGGSVMDVLGKLPLTTTTEDFGSGFQKKSNEWECNVCLVRNDDKNTSCVACTTVRPGAQTSSKLLTSTSGSGFGNTFCPPSGSWCCPTCMVNNVETTVTCVACATEKPGASRTNVSDAGGLGVSNLATDASTGFLKQFSKPNTWECATCLIRNDNNLTKCCACETLRPNVSQPNTSSVQSFSGFKFGQQSSETAGNISSVSFKFGLPSTLKASPALAESSTTTKTSMIFGVSEPSKVSQGFVFGGPVSDAKISEGFKFGLPVSKPSAVLSGSVKGNPNELNSSAVIFGGEGKVSSVKCTEKTETSRTPFILGASSGTVDREGAATFTFGQTTAKVSKPVESSDINRTKDVANVFQAGQSKAQSTNTASFGRSEPPTVPQLSNTATMASENYRQEPVLDSFKDNTRKLLDSKLAAYSTEDSKASALPLNSQGKQLDLTNGTPVGIQLTTKEKEIPPTSKSSSIVSSAGNVPSSNCATGMVLETGKVQQAFSTQPVSNGTSNANGGGFVFGVSKPVQATTPNTGGFTFSFGNTTTGGTSTPFSFGGAPSSTTVATTTASSTLFTFGKTSAAATNSTFQPASFTFGASSATDNSGNATISFAGKDSKPVFGSFCPPTSVPAATAALPVPSFGQPSITTSAEPFRFGAPSGLAVTSSVSGTFRPGYGEPAVSTTTDKNLFRFGASLQSNSAGITQSVFPGTQSQGSAGGVFTFGSPAVPGPAPSLVSSEGANFPPAESQPFVFGSGILTNSAPSTVPSFSLQSDGEANPFNVSSSGTTGQRVIRKAVRRVLKKK